MKITDFDFSLPAGLIAQHPLPQRDQSRMMTVHCRERRWEHRRFFELPEILNPMDFLVLNNTRVFPARLRARRPGKSDRIEILLVREESPGIWRTLVKPAKKAPVGQTLEVAGRLATVLEMRADGSRALRFSPADGLMEQLESDGEPPLPPYIARRPGDDLTEDKLRYQTIYARHAGSIAAPTAGLHFTPEIMTRLEGRNIGFCEILLHVGCGTFQPVRCEDVEKHQLEPEYFEVSADAAARINRWKCEGRRLVAVGTTTTRVLEHWAGQAGNPGRAESGYCDLFIHPGYRFSIVDGLLTNFHLPKSTLFMLVCAFAGLEFMRLCYIEAIRQGYRFFSYGDCMLILP